MRHYPHPYKLPREDGTLGSVVLLLTLCALLVSGWRACTRPRRHQRPA